VTLSPAHRIEKLQVGDIMIPLDKYPQVDPGTTIRDAMRLMESSRLLVDGKPSLPRVLLVIDDAGRFHGTVRRRDIMRGLEPSFLVSQPLNYRKKLFDVEIDPNLTEMSLGRVVKGVRENAEHPVREIMRPIKVTLETSDNIIKGIYEMVGHGLTLLPVLDQGQMVGVIRTVELMRELHRIVTDEDDDSQGATGQGTTS
jgi:CBS domain-containing protein